MSTLQTVEVIISGINSISFNFCNMRTTFGTSIQSWLHDLTIEIMPFKDGYMISQTRNRTITIHTVKGKIIRLYVECGIKGPDVEDNLDFVYATEVTRMMLFTGSS